MEETVAASSWLAEYWRRSPRICIRSERPEVYVGPGVVVPEVVRRALAGLCPYTHNSDPRELTPGVRGWFVRRLCITSQLLTRMSTIEHNTGATATLERLALQWFRMCMPPSGEHLWVFLHEEQCMRVEIELLLPQIGTQLAA